MKEHEDFWKGVLHAHLSAAFTAMGRLYETEGDGRTLAALIAFSIKHRAALFGRDALRRRKLHSGLSKKDADEFVSRIVEVEGKDFRAIQKEVARGRDLYNQKARPIRNDVFAHAGNLDFSQSGILFANMPVHEFELLSLVPLRVEESLYQCFLNGGVPVLEDPPWQIGDVMANLPGKQNGAWHHLHIAEDVKKLLEWMSTNAALARRWREDVGAKISQPK